MGVRKDSNKGSKYIFRSADFYNLLDTQEYKCKYSGRELTPENTQGVHVVPLQKGGNHNVENIVLVDKHVHYVKKYLEPEQLFNLAKDIVNEIGGEHGYRLSKIRKR